MPRDNLAVVRRAYELLARRGGLDELAAEVLAEDVEFDFSELPDGVVVKGMDAYREMREDFPWQGELTIEPESMVELGGDRVLVEVRVKGVSARAGLPVEGLNAHLLTLRDGRLVHFQMFTDRDRARQIAGLA